MESIKIDGKILYLSFPDELKIPWIGDKQYIHQVHTAWMQNDAQKTIQSPFNPKIIGRCGMGKTTLAYSAAKLFHPNSPSEVFIFHCANTLTPDQILIHIVDAETNIEYHASPLVTAMVKGGICIIDECQYLSSDLWAVITSLLDQRYIISDIAGLKIHAHENFRVCFTQESSEKTNKTKMIPEYISSLLKPAININHPNRKHELEVLKYFFPQSNPNILLKMVDFLQSAHFEERPYSIRDCINIIQRYESITSDSIDAEIDWNTVYQSVKHILDNQAVYFLNDLLNQSKDSDPLFKDEDFDIFDDKNKGPQEDIDDLFEDEDDDYAEFVDEEDIEDFDDSFFFLNGKDFGDPDQTKKTDSSIPDKKFIQNIQKKVQNKLKNKKENIGKN